MKIPDKKFKYDLPLHISRALIEGKKEYLWLDIQKGRFNHTIYLLLNNELLYIQMVPICIELQDITK